MSPASSRRLHPSPGERGATSLEFALVVVPFVFILIAGMDLGRYFITQHSLRTLTSEAVRLAMINCFGVDPCPYPVAVPSPWTVWAKVPFLDPTLQGASLTVRQDLDSATGVKTVTATATYPVKFVLPVWDDRTIMQATSFKY